MFSLLGLPGIGSTQADLDNLKILSLQLEWTYVLLFLFIFLIMNRILKLAYGRTSKIWNFMYYFPIRFNMPCATDYTLISF